MSHTPHELAEEFPDKIELMRKLRLHDAHFARLADTYHEINRAVHRAETQVEATDDTHEADMRRERMWLKDQIAAILAREAA
ncbi:hypothetical protein ACMU_05990 [Actibacterium mucosum KCTC 23349]|uniref:GTP-binding protein n=1 Tax=Actibacterium mucosum KCTC 23349 TaxID=1454373 RepID=A0A037ZNV1_9RHOB|nr:DUF465 domain-containing protein [Actibacterium mucosum]KAJ56491.1 hypothetical protein ACMU_05990 [Actibacterium mucosum KCTC 23349]